MGNTPNWNIYYAENGAPADARTESATQAGTVEAALDSVGGDIVSVNNFGIQYFANASARDLALTSPSVGWLTQLDSELFMRRWDGAAWRPYGSGLFPISPSSVAGTGVTIGSDGVVNFAAAGTININGVFSADFRDYRVELEVTAASADLVVNGRLRASSSDSSSGYANQFLIGSGTTATAGVGATDLFYFNISGSRRVSSGLTLRGPALASPSVISTTLGGFPNSGDGHVGNSVSQHTAATAYDGFTAYVASGNITGYIRIFGVA